MNYNQLIHNLNSSYNRMARLRARIQQNQKDIIVKGQHDQARKEQNERAR